MQNAIDALRSSILRVRNLSGLHNALSSWTTKAVDTSDLLRDQIVLGVSALDYYIHEITLLGMVEVFEGQRPPTPGFQKFKVSVSSMLNGYTSNDSSWFVSEIREQHSYKSFQDPEKIAEAIRLFSTVKLWHEVSALFRKPKEEIEAHLKQIVKRRNQIAHEADIRAGYMDERWPINAHDVDHAITFLLETCEHMHTVVG